MRLDDSGRRTNQSRYMGPEGVGNDSISQIAKDASEGLLVTLPKSFDQDPTNVALADAFKAKKEEPSGELTAWLVEVRDRLKDQGAVDLLD